MHHYFEAITNTKGDSLVGFFARVIDPVTLAVVPIYADNSATAISTISGVANMAKTDSNGNLSFYIAPGTYHLDIYGTDSTTFILRVPSVAMAGDISEAAAAALVAAQAAATAAAASQGAAAGSATAAAASASSASTSSASAAAQAGAAVTASATAGAYPNSAATNVPRGLTQASVGAITAGASGTNGTFALAWSGGNFSTNPTGTFTVAGGVLTAVTITGPGLYIGASPTVPTPSFAASTGLTGAAVALTAQFLVTSGQYYWVQSAAGDELDRYQNASGTATAASTIGPLPTTVAVAGAITAASTAAVANYVQQMRSAVGSGTLAALFDMDGPRTAYSGSPTVMTAIQSMEGNAYSLGLYATIYSGANPRPVYTAGRGIYLSSGAGFDTTSQMLPKTSGDFAFIYSVDLNTLTSTVALKASLPGSPTDGDLVLVNGDTNIDPGSGADTPLVLDVNFSDSELTNGYYKRNNYASTWEASTYLFQAYGSGGQLFFAKITHLGQLQVYLYDGTNQALLFSKGSVVVGQSNLTFCVRRKGGMLYLIVNGKYVHGLGTTLPNVNALAQWYINGNGRQGAVAQPVQIGIRHYFKGMAIGDDLTEPNFRRFYDVFAGQHGQPALSSPRAARGVAYIGQSWAQGSTGVTDTWRHGPNNWDGMVRVNNAALHLESETITRESFSNVYMSRDIDNAGDIAPWHIDVASSGNQQNAFSHCGSSTGENMIAGWAKQVNAHTYGPQSDWFVACEGIGGASIAVLNSQTVVPLVQQIKTVTLQTNDYYNKLVRQIVYHRDFALSRGQTYTVDLILWQQGHTDINNGSYLTALRSFYDQLVTDIRAITGQSHKPVLLAAQINWSIDGAVNSGNSGIGVIDQLFLDMEDTRSTSLPTGDTVPRPMYCVGPMYPYTNFIHPPRTGHRWAGEIYGLATTRVLFDGESYGCCRPYAYTYSVGGTTIDIDYRVRSGRSMIVNATNTNNVYAAVSNAGYEFTDASSGGVTISSVTAVSASRIRVTLSGPIGAGDRISYTGSTHRTGNVADGAAVNGLYNDQDWTATFTSNEPPFKLSSNFNDLRQWAAASTKVL